MKKQGLLAGFMLMAAMVFALCGISAASGAGPAIGDKASDGTLYKPYASVIVPWTGGEKVADGTVYAGVSPDTHKALYTAPADAPGSYPAGWYWSSSSLNNYYYDAWGQRFSDGAKGGHDRLVGSSLRCVR